MDDILTEEEILNIRAKWLILDCPDEKTATAIALERLRGLLQAQIDKLKRNNGLKEGVNG